MTPGEIGGVGLGATGGGGLLQAFGSISSGISNQKMYDYQSSIATLNQHIDEQNAEFARQTGEQDSAQYGFKAGQRMGKITTAQASSGFDVRSGSNAQVRSSQQHLDQLDIDVIRSNAAKTAYGYELQGAAAGAQASLYKMAGDNAMSAGIIGAGSSLLGTAGSVSSEWLQGNKSNLWGTNP